tara:strand:- start:1604 stop:1954 length:351 start_codon:yes stop_codon:yes gene_type:complete
MRNFIIGCVIGALVVAVFAVLIGGVLGAGTERRLIDDWRKIQPGMTLDDVKSELGEPSGHFPIGQGFPEWAERSVPNDYFENHGLLTYVIPLIGPQVLLIYYDSDDRVVFVSSVPT